MNLLDAMNPVNVLWNQDGAAGSLDDPVSSYFQSARVTYIIASRSLSPKSMPTNCLPANFMHFGRLRNSKSR